TFRTYATARTYPFSTPNHPSQITNPQVKPISTENSSRGVQTQVGREKVELARRERAYRGDRPPLDVTGRTVILVDDGIATGSSMIAALRALRAAARLVVAVPVGPASVCRELRREADEVICASSPPEFESVGQAFADFHQVSDDEVRELLATPTVD
ncbi:phosphoribosyltransferase family protein, partial [Mycolicibacterium mageritense]